MLSFLLTYFFLLFPPKFEPEGKMQWNYSYPSTSLNYLRSLLGLYSVHLDLHILVGFVIMSDPHPY